MLGRLLWPALALALLAAGCGSDGTGGTDRAGPSSSIATDQTSTSTDPDTDPAAGSETAPATGSATTGSSTTSTAATGGSDGAPGEGARIDLLTIASGVTIHSFDGDGAWASRGVRAIDGEMDQIGFGTDTDDPVSYTFELPAETTFDRFAVPDTRNSPGNTTFYGAVEVAGSNTGPADGFDVLVSEPFVELPADQELAEFVPTSQQPVRWIKLTLSGALQVEPEHEPGRTVVRFTELIGNGTQAVVPLSGDFTGVWELTFADNPDGAGELTELVQDGARVAGCVGFATVTGTVTGNVVRLIGVDTRDERPSAYLFVVDGDGRLRGMESTNNGVFRARIGRIAAEGTATDCSETAPEPLACGAIAYVNFDLDSAVIRPDSAQVLDDLFDGISAIGDAGVMIEGHTSTEGAADYNLALSERRAEAVVEALVERGLATGRISAIGKGESEPLVSESDEASRAINRRVEIACL